MRTICLTCGLLCCAVVAIAADGDKAGDKNAAAKGKPDASPKAIAGRTFESADKDKDGSLSEEETRTAKTILRGALVSKLSKNPPGGEKTREKIEKLPAEGNPDEDRDGRVSAGEFEKYALERFKQLGEIVDKAKQAADKQREKDKERLGAEQRKQAEQRREMERRQKERQREKREDQRDKQKMQDLKQKNKKLEQKLKDEKKRDKN